MKPGWYILNYHNVGWENSLFTQALSGNHRPDVFRGHVEYLAEVGELLSVDEGLSRMRDGKSFNGPAFSFWFDDGFAGLRRHALPVLKEHRVTAAVSVVSRLVLREEMYYMSKLSFLARTDGLRFVRSRLRRLCSDRPLRIRGWMKSNFRLEFLPLIDEVYNRFTTESFRKDAFRIYDDEKGIQALADAGWLITNHSAAHYPLSESLGWEDVESGFDECSSLVRRFSTDDPFWVTPFSYLPQAYVESLKERCVIVNDRSDR